MTEEEQKSRYESLFDLLGQLAAFITIIVYLCLIINANWAFIPEGDVMDVLIIIKTFAPLIVVLVVGLEFAAKRSFLIKLAIYASIAAIVIFQFFPGTWENFIGIVKG